MNKNLLISLFILLFAVLLLRIPAHAVVSGGTGKLLLSPQTASLTVDTAQNITVLLNTAGVAISSISMRATFPVTANDLEVVSITPNNDLVSAGWSFPIKSATTTGGTTTIDIAALNMGLSGYQTNVDVPFVVIALKAHSTFAAKTLTFDTNETKMLKKSDSADMLGTPGNGSYAATNDTGATPTITPSPMPGGNTVPVCASLYTDITSSVGTPLTVTLSCSGVDTDGYINAAEFTFGDGTSQVVEKNAGSPGTITATHTYRTIGTLGTSCRVRDNNQVYSTIPDNCKKIIIIKQAPTITATPKPTTSLASGTATPTPLFGGVSETPQPTIEPSPMPTPEAAAAPTDGSSRFWWMAGGITAIVFAFLLLRRRGPPPSPPIPPMNPPADVSQSTQPQV